MRSLEVEQALIGAIIADPGRRAECGDVGRHHFHSEDLGDVWALLMTMRGHMDQVTITEAAVNAGIPVALVLACKCPAAAAVASYRDIVIESWRRREFDRVLEEARERNGSESVADIVASMDRETATIVGSGGAEAAGYEAVAEAWEDDLLGAIDGEAVGYSWGLDAIENVVGLIEPASITIIQARPSHGKSALGQQIGEGIAKTGVRVLYVLTEMNSKKMLTRSVSSRTGIDSKDLKRGNVYPDQMPAIREAIAEASALPWKILSGPNMTVAKVKAEAKRFNAEVIIVDYAQRMSGPGNGATEIVAGISKGLTDMASGDGAPALIILAQANRACDLRISDKMPLASDLKQSGQLEQDAGLILSLLIPSKHDEEADPHEMWIAFAKGRDGGGRRVKVYFDGPTTTISDWDHRNYSGIALD